MPEVIDGNVYVETAHELVSRLGEAQGVPENQVMDLFQDVLLSLDEEVISVVPSEHLSEDTDPNTPPSGLLAVVDSAQIHDIRNTAFLQKRGHLPVWVTAETLDGDATTRSFVSYMFEYARDRHQKLVL